MIKCLLIAVLASFYSCSDAGKSSLKNFKNKKVVVPQMPTDHGDNAQEEIEKKYVSNIGIKDYESIYHTMATLTGVEPSSILNKFKKDKLNLPTSNNLRDFSASNQQAITVFAAEFCAGLVDNVNLFQNVYGNDIDPVGAVSADEFQTIAERTVEKFYMYNVADDIKESSVVELKNLADELNTGENDKKKIVFGVCSAGLSSLAVLLL